MRFTTQGSLSSGVALKLKSMMALVYTGGLLAWLSNENQIILEIPHLNYFIFTDWKQEFICDLIPVSCGNTVSQLFRRGIRI